MADDRPNILVIWGDDIGITNLSCYSDGLMGYRTPNIDRIADEGMRFTDSYGEQSCTAGRSVVHHGSERVSHRAQQGRVSPAPTSAFRPRTSPSPSCLKPLGYATGQFGKNHLGDLNKYLPTVHGFDEFFGNLYHLNAEEEPELPNWPSKEEFPRFNEMFRPARRAPLLGHRRGRPDGRRALRSRRQAEDRGHRPADEEADGDDRRRVRATASTSSSAQDRRGSAVVLLVQHHAHAPAHAHRSPRASARPGAGSRPTTTR